MRGNGVLRRRWRGILAVCWWGGLCGLTAIDAGSGADWAQLAVGLLLVTVAVVAARRVPALSLAVGLASGFVVVFDFGGHYPVWQIFLMVSASYFAGRRRARWQPTLGVFAAVSLAGIPFALFVPGTTGFGGWGAAMGLLVFAGIFPWQLGRYVRTREQMALTGWQRAEEME
ncbi:sensor histidine kinase, partial [Amycolatopsis sp. H20-H5]|nr:sensor histidine kinase [Amycolatopsis sp. H20-H5]